MNRKHILLLLAAALLTATAPLLMACGSDDDNTTVPTVTPNATGEFIDARDGNVYHYVTYAGLDWTVENARYDTGSDDTRTIYLTNDAIGDDEGTAAQQTLATYGYLYTWQGAQKAVPDGWRLPTDDDWKKLEMALGMTQQQADADGWRGTLQGTLMHQKDGTGLNMRYGGFMDGLSTSYASKYYFIQAMGYYWTATPGDDRQSTAYIRKLMYNRQDVYRHTSSVQNMMSVRFVRDTPAKK